MAASRFYIISSPAPVAIAVAQTLTQIVTGTTVPVDIARAQVTETLSVTSTKQRIQFNRKSTLNTGMTALTTANILPTNPGDSASSLSLGTALTATWLTGQTENADNQPLVQDTFNFLSPWVYLPVPEERFAIVAGGGTGNGNAAFKFPAAPASGTFEWEIAVRELC